MPGIISAAERISLNESLKPTLHGNILPTLALTAVTVNLFFFHSLSGGIIFFSALADLSAKLPCSAHAGNDANMFYKDGKIRHTAMAIEFLLAAGIFAHAGS